MATLRFFQPIKLVLAASGRRLLPVAFSLDLKNDSMVNKAINSSDCHHRVGEDTIVVTPKIRTATRASNLESIRGRKHGKQAKKL